MELLKCNNKDYCLWNYLDPQWSGHVSQVVQIGRVTEPTLTILKNLEISKSKNMEITGTKNYRMLSL